MIEQKYKEMSLGDIKDILDKTIKHDDNNKIITFLGMLLAFTEDSQFNILFNSPSSTGKSYIPLEVVKLFPKDSVMKFGYCTPTAFYHNNSNVKKTDSFDYTVDLSRKILIFIDQPHSGLLANLRPMLSHDEKEIEVNITDKKNKGGMQTKKVTMIGYPVVVYCTANSRIDEQEITRFFVLSPELTQNKIKEGIEHAIKSESLGDNYKNNIYLDEDYLNLKSRLNDIKNIKIDNIIIKDHSKIQDEFKNKGSVESKDMRSVKRLISIIKSVTLLNVWFRERSGDGKTIYSNEKDIEEGLKIWNIVSESENFGLSSYMLDIFEKVVYPLSEDVSFDKNTDGITRKQIMNKYYEVFGRYLPLYTLRSEIIPILSRTGLIYEDDDPKDKRIKLIFINPNYKEKWLRKLESKVENNPVS